MHMTPIIFSVTVILHATVVACKKKTLEASVSGLIQMVL